MVNAIYGTGSNTETETSGRDTQTFSSKRSGTGGENYVRLPTSDGAPQAMHKTSRH